MQMPARVIEWFVTIFPGYGSYFKMSCRVMSQFYEDLLWLGVNVNY